jgi:hypothetical protein
MRGDSEGLKARVGLSRAGRSNGLLRLLSSPRGLRGLFLAGLFLAASSTEAADLGRSGPGPSAGPGPYHGAAGCRLVVQPQFNLYNDVTWYRQIWVCPTRGVYADTLWPYPWPY